MTVEAVPPSSGIVGVVRLRWGSWEMKEIDPSVVQAGKPVRGPGQVGLHLRVGSGAGDSSRFPGVQLFLLCSVGSQFCHLVNDSGPLF